VRRASRIACGEADAQVERSAREVDARVAALDGAAHPGNSGRRISHGRQAPPREHDPAAGQLRVDAPHPGMARA
jgi:hypothetical protein